MEYPTAPGDSLWINNVQLFTLGQSSLGSWGVEWHTFDPEIGFMELGNTITIYSEGLDRIPEMGRDDFMIGELYVDYNAVPIPSAFLLFGPGLIALVGLKKKLED